MGRPWVFLERCEAIKILYNHVKDKSKVRAHTAVESYTESENDITVKTSTGETIEGSILVGSDGIHSHVRTLMADEIAKTEPDVAKEIKEGNARQNPLLEGSQLTCPTRRLHDRVQVPLRRVQE